MISFRFLLKPWFWVLLGAMMTAGSAIISHYVISNNNAAIMSLLQKASQIDENIISSWENVGRMERDGNTAMLMALTFEGGRGKYKDNKGAYNGIKAYLNNLARQYGDEEFKNYTQKIYDGEEGDNNLIPAILEFIQHSREESIELINKQYLEKITLEEEAIEIEHINAKYSNIAVFLQIIGLIMVISKDLARRTWPS